LLQHNHPGDALAVLPIIDGAEVGKRTFSAHVFFFRNGLMCVVTKWFVHATLLFCT
jgi:hypothetical protein